MCCVVYVCMCLLWHMYGRSEDNMQASALSFDHMGSEIKFKLSDLVAGHWPVTLLFLVSFNTHVLDEAVNKTKEYKDWAAWLSCGHSTAPHYIDNIAIDR